MRGHVLEPMPRLSGLVLGVVGTVAVISLLWSLAPRAEETGSFSTLSGSSSPAKTETVVSERDAVCKGPRLILHVGPKKTGTSALQKLLVKYGTYLENQWSVSVGFDEPKSAAYHLAIPLWKENRVENGCESKQNAEEVKKSVSYIKTKLSSWPVVVLSSEAFSTATFTNTS